MLSLVLPNPLLAADSQGLSSLPVAQGKKAVALTPIQNVQIEMPDQSIHNFGEDLQASLTTQLTQSGRYIVIDPLSSHTIKPKKQYPFNWGINGTGV